MNRGRRRGSGGARAVALAGALLASAASADPVLFDGGGGWLAAAGAPESAPPEPGAWLPAAGIWIGRSPADAAALAWAGKSWPLAGLPAAPLAPVELPVVRNPFGPCLVKSLSMRYDSVVRSREWSLVFTEEDADPDFRPLVFPGGRELELALWLEDAASGVRWRLRPTRQGREAGVRLPWTGSDARFYGGEVDGERIDWSLVVAPGEREQWLLQGQVQALDGVPRRLRLRIGLRGAGPASTVLQADSPPAIVWVRDGEAAALFADPAEPRRLRFVTDEPDAAALEADLAVTRATGNFPGRAAFSFEADAWRTSGPEAAPREAARRWPHAGGSVALPEAVRRGAAGAWSVFQPARDILQLPGGFRDEADAMQYLMLKTSALFPDRTWAASAFLCAAQAGTGRRRFEPADAGAVLAVNPDPDLQIMLELGQNRGRTVLAEIRRNPAPAVWIQCAGAGAGLDCGARALYLCDFPAVWEEGTEALGVDLGHAEAELLASLACVLKEQGVCLLVSDDGPLAPFTTYHADALVCTSADPVEMRRQHDLAGGRPVVWLPADAAPGAADLAQELGFVRPGGIMEN